MNQSEVTEFARFELYDMTNGVHHTIALYNELSLAEYNAKLLAYRDKDSETYYITNVDIPNTLVFGGGWVISYQKDKYGIVRRHELS